MKYAYNIRKHRISILAEEPLDKKGNIDKKSKVTKTLKSQNIEI